MKKAAGIVIVLVLFAIAAYMLWTRAHTPVEIKLQNMQLQQGYLVGEVANTGERAIDHAEVTVTFKDSSGHTTTAPPVETSPIQPGQTLSLHIQAPPNATGFNANVTGQSGGL